MARRGTRRRYGRGVTATTLLMLLPMLGLWLFGAGRIEIPFAIVGVALDAERELVLAGILAWTIAPVFLFSSRVGEWVGEVVVGWREPTEEERRRVEPLVARICAAAKVDAGKLRLRVETGDDVNASATGGRYLTLTTAAFALPDEYLEAILGHEVGHHKDLHPVMGMLTWWYSLPTVFLKYVYRQLRRCVGWIVARFRGVLIPIGYVLVAVIWVVQVNALLLAYVAEVFAAKLERRSELDADANATAWGYGGALVEVYGAFVAAGKDEPPKRFRRLKRLFATHPPFGERIACIERLDVESPAITAPVAQSP